MSKPTLDWDFNLKTEKEFKLDLKYTGKINRIMKHILGLTEKKIFKKDVGFTKITDSKKEIKIDPKYYNSIKTFLKPNINKILKDIKKDGIEVMSYFVEEGVFIKNQNNDWDIKITLFGFYADKR